MTYWTQPGTSPLHSSIDETAIQLIRGFKSYHKLVSRDTLVEYLGKYPKLNLADAKQVDGQLLWDWEHHVNMKVKDHTDLIGRGRSSPLPLLRTLMVALCEPTYHVTDIAHWMQRDRTNIIHYRNNHFAYLTGWKIYRPLYIAMKYKIHEQ